MLQNLRILLSAVFFVYFLGLSKHLEAEEIFQQGDHCLAYQTEETILLVFDLVVVGKTCEISARVKREGENTRFVVSFPIRSLDSGIGMRDEDVSEILSVESQPEILFVSDFFTWQQIKSALTNNQISLSIDKGNLLLGTWQGLYLFEHRLNSQNRTIIHHFIGE